MAFQHRYSFVLWFSLAAVYQHLQKHAANPNQGIHFLQSGRFEVESLSHCGGTALEFDRDHLGQTVS